jgi:hypothetical protein
MSSRRDATKAFLEKSLHGNVNWFMKFAIRRQLSFLLVVELIKASAAPDRQLMCGTFWFPLTSRTKEEAQKPARSATVIILVLSSSAVKGVVRDSALGLNAAGTESLLRQTEDIELAARCDAG